MMATHSTSTQPHPWDEAAQGWNRHTTAIHAWLQDATTEMLDSAGIASGARVLDVAAGAGDQTLDIAHRVGATARYWQPTSPVPSWHSRKTSCALPVFRRCARKWLMRKRSGWRAPTSMQRSAGWG